jgi:4,5-dihydroxyphthalate decarboxylase
VKAKVALVGYDRVQAIADGRVGVDGLELDVTLSAPSEIFYRMLAEDAFDICEMSFHSTIMQKARGRDWTVLPIFPFRSLFHTGFFTREGVERPEDLRGGRIGLVEYQVTAALWGRGVLADDFGVDPAGVDWFVERSGALSHSAAGGFPPPSGASVHPIPEDSSVGEMLVAGELDAVLPSPMPSIANRFNRTDERTLLGQPGVKRLFPDPLAETRRYYEAHGFLHMNHVIVVRTELVRNRPELPTELLDMFEQSKAIALGERDRLRRSSLLFSHLLFEEQDRLFGPDPFPYGVSANESAVRTAIGRSVADGFLERPLELDDLFAETLLDT